MEKIVKRGKLLFGIAIAAIGVENLICAHVSLPVFSKSGAVVPVIPFFPAIPFLVYLVGIVLFATGLGIAADFRPFLMAILLGLFFLLCVLVLFVPKAVASPLDLNIRTCFFEELALGASAFILAGCLQKEEPNFARGRRPLDSAIDKLVASGPYLFAVSSIVFGITHFLILRFIASLVPAWLPGGLFWAYLTGAGFIAAGISIATGVMARWGAFWLGIMFLFWFLFLHAPRVATSPHNPAEWSSALIALGMCGGSWIVAWGSLQSNH
jgi:hypothetical protein